MSLARKAIRDIYFTYPCYRYTPNLVYDRLRETRASLPLRLAGYLHDIKYITHGNVPKSITETKSVHDALTALNFKADVTEPLRHLGIAYLYRHSTNPHLSKGNIDLSGRTKDGLVRMQLTYFLDEPFRYLSTKEISQIEEFRKENPYFVHSVKLMEILDGHEVVIDEPLASFREKLDRKVTSGLWKDLHKYFDQDGQACDKSDSDNEL